MGYGLDTGILYIEEDLYFMEMAFYLVK